MNTRLAVLFFSVVILISCDPEELFKAKNAPEAGKIQSDASAFVVNPTDTVKFWVMASDPDGGELNYEWSIKDDKGNHAGVYIGSTKTDSLKWKAPISGGIFEVKVTISNSDESITRTEEITVVTLVAPLVTILNPKEAEYVVQYQYILVRAEVIHPLGIYQTALIVNDTILVTIASGNGADDFEYNWKADIPAGRAEIKIVAEANVTGSTGSDSIIVNIEGVVPGKN
jgi:hypothetical protein